MEGNGLSKTYAVWLIMHQFVLMHTKNSKPETIREFRSVLERLCISLTKKYGSEFWQQYDAEIFQKFVDEINSHKTLKKAFDGNTVAQELAAVFEQPKVLEIVEAKRDNHKQFSCGEFKQVLPTTIVAKLSQQGNVEQIVCMLLRLDSLCPGGQQWAMPKTWFDNINKMFSSGTILIAFSSPINVQMNNIQFGCLHDEDKTFGGLGDFFSIDFDVFFQRHIGKRVVVTMNPPFIESILAQAAHHVETMMQIANEHKTELLVFFNGPEWNDAGSVFFHALENSTFRKASKKLQKQNHYYEDCFTEEQRHSGGSGSHLWALDNTHSISSNSVDYSTMTIGFETAGKISAANKYSGRGYRPSRK